MRTIELDNLSFIASPKEKKFVVLRSTKADEATFLENYAVPKIVNRNNANTIPGVWGTLGYANNKPIDWAGQFACSNEGNDDFVQDSTVFEEVELIKKLYPNLNIKGGIKEKVINLSELEIPFDDVFSLEELPKLRLDVFLGPDQGALAFYQYQKENNKEAELDYILPQKTENHNTDERDRLTYLFNVIPQKSIEPVPDIPNRFRISTKLRQKDFIVKILIFDRAFSNQNESKLPSKSREIIELIEDELASYKTGLLVKKHELLVMTKHKKKFYSAEKGLIDESKKTLLLLHGTFASTKGSFGEVYSWIFEFLSENKYEQVVAFDHPTFFYDAEMNINMLHKKLNEVGVQAFSKEVDIIGTSQGGLLAQYLANSKQSSINVGRVALVASANGVGYFTFAEGLAFGLKFLRKAMSRVGAVPVAFVAALLQHSFEWVIKQPGMAVMTPGHEKLNEIIYQTPRLKSTRYYPVASDYEAKRGFKEKLELGIDLILSEHNDWVVGTKNQFSAPSEYVAIKGYNPGKYRDFMIHNAIHGSLIEKEECQERLESFFFTDEIKYVDYLKENSSDYFDAHCHLFGRNVITGRLLLMLLGDLIDYLGSEEGTYEPINLREEEGEGHGIGSVIKNIFKYFLFNKGAHQMLHDLQEDYVKQSSEVYRFVPLMFDLEMTFRNKYDMNESSSFIEQKLEEFKEKHDEFLNHIDGIIDRFEENEELIFNGTMVDNEHSVRILKYAKTILKGLDLINSTVAKDAKESYSLQVKELSQLKVSLGGDVYPFLAVDPRRERMGEEVKNRIGKKKVFHGVKIYAPNGYSVTDRNLFDSSKNFVDNKSLYQWCCDNDIPIMAHCSDAGFATFTSSLEVYGDVCTWELDESNSDYTYKLDFKNKEKVPFENNLFSGGFGKSVKERAHLLNHPTLWRKVLEEYPTLKVCLAHFGGESEEWQKEISRLILDFDNVYTDLSCQTSAKMLEKISNSYFKTNTEENLKIRSRIMYGSDYFLNMLHGMKFKNYYGNFNNYFSKDDLKKMSQEVVKNYLGI